MANEDVFGSNAGESSARNKGRHAEEQASHTAEDSKSAAATVTKDYTEKTNATLDEAKKRLRTLRDDGEDYVRTNPVKAVLGALGVGFILGVMLKR